MDFLHLTFNDFEFRDLGHSGFLSFKVLAPTPKNTDHRYSEYDQIGHTHL